MPAVNFVWLCPGTMDGGCLKLGRDLTRRKSGCPRWGDQLSLREQSCAEPKRRRAKGSAPQTLNPLTLWGASPDHLLLGAPALGLILNTYFFFFFFFFFFLCLFMATLGHSQKKKKKFGEKKGTWTYPVNSPVKQHHVVYVKICAAFLCVNHTSVK